MRLPVILLTTTTLLSLPGRAASQTPEPCRIRTQPGVDSSWQHVTGTGLIFCVPPGWQQRHPRGDSMALRVWTDGLDSVVWGTGRPPTLEPDYPRTITGTITGTVEPGGSPSTGTPAPTPMPEPSCIRDRTPFLIGRAVVVVDRVHCEGRWMVTAWSATPALFVQGSARSEDEADLIFLLMRSVRITAPIPADPPRDSAATRP